MSELDTVSREWAWEAYEPSANRPWDRRGAAHLYRRAAFGANSEELDIAVKLGPAGAVSLLFEGSAEPGALETFQAQGARLGQAMMGASENLGAWWLYRMGKSPTPLVEQMALFWHGHFATSAAKVDSARLMQNQDRLFHEHALGNFAALAQAIAKDPAMLVWLDSQSNRKSRPNENFARELLELFCLGTGHYTEQDIRELARCFTGWEVRRDAFSFNPRQHDGGRKKFLGREGAFGGEEALGIVLEQEAAPLFIARKLARQFIAEEPEIPERLLAPLAAQLREEAFEVRPVVERILRSNLFNSKHALGRKVRSPVALGIGLVRCFSASTDYVRLNEDLSRLGQALYFPPNVKGWEGGRTWIHSATVLGRGNLVGRFTHGKETRFAAGSLEATARAAGAEGFEETMGWLSDMLVALPLSGATRDALRKAVGQVSAGQVVGRLLHALSWTPEFHLA